MKFDFRIEKLSYKVFLSFIKDVEKDFVPPLLERIDVETYFNKVNTYAAFIECYDDNELAGLLISYVNNKETRKGFVTFIAVKERYRGNGIAGNLLDKACEFAKRNGMSLMGIDTNNIIARDCYIKNGFKLIESHKIENSLLERFYLEKTF